MTDPATPITPSLAAAAAVPPTASPATLPIATPATADLICWLWAAFPPQNGQLPLRRIADVLGVSPTTLRRWIADPTGRSFDHQTQRYLIRRAILRGRGTYLWPPLDPATQERTAGERAHAINATRSIRLGIYPPAWETNGTFYGYSVLVVRYPRAHVYGVHTIRTDKARAKIHHDSELVDEISTQHRYEALTLKHLLLDTITDIRCIAPAALVPTGRTDTWQGRDHEPSRLRDLKRRQLPRVLRSPAL